MTWKSAALASTMGAVLTAFPMISYANTVRDPLKTVFGHRTYTLQDETRDLFSDVSEDALVASIHADTLWSATRQTDTDWRLDASELSYIKDAVNDMGKKIARLETLKKYSSPVERRAIEKIIPMAKELAANTNDAINFLNDHENSPWLPSYQQLTAKLDDHATAISNTLDRSMKLASLRQHETRLKRELKAEGGM